MVEKVALAEELSYHEVVDAEAIMQVIHHT
jgi:hypothetical protein